MDTEKKKKQGKRGGGGRKRRDEKDALISPICSSSLFVVSISSPLSLCSFPFSSFLSSSVLPFLPLSRLPSSILLVHPFSLIPNILVLPSFVQFPFSFHSPLPFPLPNSPFLSCNPFPVTFLSLLSSMFTGLSCSVSFLPHSPFFPPSSLQPILLPHFLLLSACFNLSSLSSTSLLLLSSLQLPSFFSFSLFPLLTVFLSFLPSSSSFPPPPYRQRRHAFC